jgi:hypothetical protein
LNGDIEVSVDLDDDTLAEQVRAAFREFNVARVAEG